MRASIPLAFLALALLAAAACDQRHVACEICGRGLHENTSVLTRGESGTGTEFCCVRCAVRAGVPVDRAGITTVRDFATGERIDASRAVLVEGGDVHVCRGPVLRPPVDDTGRQLTPVYDRCEPSVVAFADRKAAREFVARHGGHITAWSALSRQQEGP